MKDKGVIGRGKSTHCCFNELALKDENERIDREGLDKFNGSCECESGENAFEILDSIQNKPGLFKKVFSF